MSQLISMISAFVDVKANLDEKEPQCRQRPVVRSLRQPESIKDVASIGLLHVAQLRHMSPMAISPNICTAILLMQNHWHPAFMHLKKEIGMHDNIAMCGPQNLAQRLGLRQTFLDCEGCSFQSSVPSAASRLLELVMD